MTEDDKRPFNREHAKQKELYDQYHQDLAEYKRQLRELNPNEEEGELDLDHDEEMQQKRKFKIFDLSYHFFHRKIPSTSIVTCEIGLRPRR